MSIGRQHLTGRKWEVVGYSWRQGIVSGKWDVMRVFGDGSSDAAEFRSYDTEKQAQERAIVMGMDKGLPAFAPEHPMMVFNPEAASAAAISGNSHHEDGL